MASRLKKEWLEGSFREYVTKWLWPKWGYARCWEHHFPEMLLWYSAAGSAVLNEQAADEFVRRVRVNSVDELPEGRRGTWDAAVALAADLARRGRNPVEWFTGGCGDIESARESLDDVPNIGPKIAAFLMRDLSFLRDHSDGRAETTVTYRAESDRRWFRAVTPQHQALFVPIDTYVRDAAIEFGASPTARRHDIQAIQEDPDLHRRVAIEIARWASQHDFDPRDVNVYWYSVGAENIYADGTPVECLKWSSED